MVVIAAPRTATTRMDPLRTKAVTMAANPRATVVPLPLRTTAVHLASLLYLLDG